MEAPSDPTGVIEAITPESVLSAWSPSPCPPGCGCLEPFSDGFPSELVRTAGPDRSQHRETARAATAFADQITTVATLAIVDAPRPADIPAVLGWGGTCNYGHQDLGRLCAVLRS